MVKGTRKTLKAQAVEKAMEQQDGLVHAFIRRQGGGDISYEEALQAGRVGLWHAIQGYDATRGTTFATYAWVAICRQIHQRVRELSPKTDIWTQGMPATGEELEPEEWVEQALILEALEELVGRLPERLRWVVVRRYGLGGDAPRTLQEVGEELGLTRERIRQLQQDALAWLRHPAHSLSLRELLDRNTVADYRWALAENAALRRTRRRRR